MGNRLVIKKALAQMCRFDLAGYIYLKRKRNLTIKKFYGFDKHLIRAYSCFYEIRRTNSEHVQEPCFHSGSKAEGI